MILSFVFGALLATLPSPIKSCPENLLLAFSPACSIKNLTVVSTATPGEKLVCDAPVPHTLLATQPNVFLDESNKNQSEKSDLILVAYDATQNQILWAVSNAKNTWLRSHSRLKKPNGNWIHSTSLYENGNSTFVSQANANSRILKPYEAVSIDPQQKNHTLIFAMFENSSDILAKALVNTNQSNATPFDIKEWAFRRSASGIKLCNPLAAAKFTVEIDSKCAVPQPPATCNLSKNVKRQSLFSGNDKVNDTSPKSESNSDPPKTSTAGLLAKRDATGNAEASTATPETTTGKGETTTGKVATATGKAATATGNEQPTTGKAETTTGKGETTTGKTTTNSSDNKKNLAANFRSNSAIIIVLVTLSTTGISFASK